MPVTPGPGGPGPTAVTLEGLVSRAAALADRGTRTLLGVVGAPGAGKSTLCEVLGERLGDRVVVVGMDGYHLDNEVLVALGRRDRKGAPDTFDVDGFVSLLRRLRAAEEETTYAARFDRSLELAIGSAVPVRRTVPLVVVEGNYLLCDDGGWERVRPLLDETWYLDVPDDERVRRLVARRVSHGDDPDAARRWVHGVDESNATVVVATRDRADHVLHLVTDPRRDDGV